MNDRLRFIALVLIALPVALPCSVIGFFFHVARCGFSVGVAYAAERMQPAEK